MGSRQQGTRVLGVQWESGAGDVEAFRAMSRPGSGKHVVYAAAHFCVKRAESQAEAARSQGTVWAHGCAGSTASLHTRLPTWGTTGEPLPSTVPCMPFTEKT